MCLINDVVSQLLEEKLRESEELHRIMQKDCETYKKVLAETVRAAFKYGFRRYKVVQTAVGLLISRFTN